VVRAVSKDPTQEILVFSTLNVHGTKRLLDKLRAQYANARILLLTPTELVEDFIDITSVDSLYKYKRQSSLLTTGVTLLRRLRSERFDLFVVLCGDISKTADVLNLVIFSFFIPCRGRMLLAANLASRSLGIHMQVTSILDAVLFLVAVRLAKLLTFIVTGVGLAFLGTLQFSVPASSPKGKRIAVLLPILPDLSHVFIYREVVAMLNHGAKFDVLALEEGDYGILHPEARGLLQRTTFIPKVSKTRYLLLYLYFLIRHPARLARLISFYMSRHMGGRFLFLDINNLHNPLHPLQGIILAWQLKKRRISYMHIYGSTYPATRGLVASFLLGIAFSMSTFVDFDYDYDFKMFREKAQLARFIVATTRFCAERIRSYTSEPVSRKIHVIYLGIDQSHGPVYQDGTELTKSESPCFIAVGRLVEKKGFEYLVRAVAILKARGLSPRCVIVGEGPDKVKLRALIKRLEVENEVELKGPVPNDQLATLFLKPQNILVAPSVYARDGERDGIPTVLLEAMLCGLPVISTNVSGIPELINHGDNGILVPERDDNALADAMGQLLQYPDLRERLQRNGRETVLQHFAIAESASRLWSLIKKEASR